MKVCFRILSKQTDSNTVMWLNETCICFQSGTCLACAKRSVVFLSWMVELRTMQCASLNTGTDWAIQSFPWANRITRAATSLGIAFPTQLVESVIRIHWCCWTFQEKLFCDRLKKHCIVRATQGRKSRAKGDAFYLWRRLGCSSAVECLTWSSGFDLRLYPWIQPTVLKKHQHW